MSMDGLSLNAVLNEIAFLKGKKIDKIQQPDRDSLLFSLRSDGRSCKLLLCLHTENGRIQLTDLPFENPAEPPMFCMLLRKRLIGARIEGFSQLGLDRYFEISLAGRNELGDPVSLRLCVELMDRHSNVTLVQDGIIVDCLKRVTPDMSPVRPLLPGLSFLVPPEQDKRSPFELTEEGIAAILRSERPVKLFQDSCSGVSKNVVNMLFGNEPDAGRICRKLQKLHGSGPDPVIVRKENGDPQCVLPFLPEDPFPVTEFSTMSEAYDAFYRSRDAVVRVQRNGASLKKSVEIKLKRSRNKYALYEESLGSDAEMQKNRLYGELITANLYRVSRGQSVLRCTDYTSDPPEEKAVPLDPLRSPNDNAKQYFKKYKKAKAAMDYASKMIEAEREEIAYLEGQLDNLEKCTTLQELGEIRSELVALKYLKSDHRAKPQKKEVSRPFVFLSSDGIRILVGKNNMQNDNLTLKTAAPDNLWLHTKDIPGSHVIVDFKGLPPEQTLLEAAHLAAYYSKARDSSLVPVDYTFRKVIKKPAGAKPGKVIYSTNQTLYITPDGSLVRNLKQEE